MIRLHSGLLLLPLFAGLALLVTPAHGQAALDSSSPSLIVQLARELHDAPLPMRSDFAWLSLTQMAGFYTSEAARARREMRNTSRAHDAAGWAASVEDYARKISMLANSITTETAITVNVDSTNTVSVYVNGQPVIITGAIGGQQSVYEQGVMERFCVLYICEDLLPELRYSDRELPGVVTDTDESAAYWSFSQYAGPVCMTSDGLEFQFLKMSDLGEKRLACNQAVAELSELARAISAHLQQGNRVDWKTLQVLPGVVDGQQRVRLAARAEIRLPLPLLADNPQLLARVRPWLKARVRGDSYQLVVLNAERYLGLADSPAAGPGNRRYPAFDADYDSGGR